MFLDSNWLCSAVAIVSGLRLLECLSYQLHIVLFAQYRVRLERWLYSYRRSVILLSFNYVETIFSKLLPYIGLELGDPTVIFIDRFGVRRTMRNGSWIK
jgi:hypothetical protein